QILGLSGGELAVLDAIGDAILLIFLALLNGRRISGRRRAGSRLREPRRHSQSDQSCTIEDEICNFHDVSPVFARFTSLVSSRNFVGVCTFHQTRERRKS